MFVHTIQLTNLLSYGARSAPVTLRPLNVIIGTNGSGKSNLLDAFDLLRNTPDQIQKPIREGGGIREWLWKGHANHASPTASLDVVIAHPSKKDPDIRYQIAFTENSQRFVLIDERVENDKAGQTEGAPCFYYRFQHGQPIITAAGNGVRNLQAETLDLERSILAQKRDVDQYPELTYLAGALERCRLYRDWNMGRNVPLRMPQRADSPNDFLAEDCSNLGLVLNRIRQAPEAKRSLLKSLRILFEGIEDYNVLIEGGTVQVFLEENGVTIPATRLSDGTLRYLCLLAILCHPSPPPLTCIEEPELGLHPDILPEVATLLKHASQKGQLIVTTHSDVLVDALSDQPECVLVAEKTADGTTLTRLDAEQLHPWLAKYRLGQLWTRGEIGGTRW